MENICTDQQNCKFARMCSMYREEVTCNPHMMRSKKSLERVYTDLMY